MDLESVCAPFFLLGSLSMVIDWLPSRTLPNMSQGIKAINKSVSKLVGLDNYQEWMRSMQSTLMALDLWWITSGTEVHPGFTDPLVPTAAEQLAWDNWDITNTRAMGLLRVSLRAHVLDKVVQQPDQEVATIWTYLQAEYGQIALATMFQWHKDTKSFKIAANRHPGPAMDQLENLFRQLKTNAWNVLDNEHAHDLLMAIPLEWEKVCTPLALIGSTITTLTWALT